MLISGDTRLKIWIIGGYFESCINEIIFNSFLRLSLLARIFTFSAIIAYTVFSLMLGIEYLAKPSNHHFLLMLSKVVYPYMLVFCLICMVTVELIYRITKIEEFNVFGLAPKEEWYYFSKEKFKEYVIGAIEL